jgi:hypothetical protein
MEAIRFPRTDEISVMSVHYWCRCNLRNGFRVWHDAGIGTNEESKFIWRDHIAVKTFSESDFNLVTQRWCGFGAASVEP